LFPYQAFQSRQDNGKDWAQAEAWTQFWAAVAEGPSSRISLPVDIPAQRPQNPPNLLKKNAKRR